LFRICTGALAAGRRRLRRPAGFVVVALLFYAVDGLHAHASALGRQPAVLTAAIIVLRPRCSDVTRFGFGWVYNRNRPGYLRMSSSPNVRLTPRESVRVRGPYGTARIVVRTGIALDDVKQLEHAMRA
jgi:hypothetical protein